MHPSHVNQIGTSSDVRDYTRRSLLSQNTQLLSRSTSSGRRLRAEDSWIEISSQPSSSSLSSAGENDVITTGLYIEPHPIGHQPPQLRLRTRSQSVTSIPAGPLSAAGSSQDEYEESESESDRVMGSSTEDVARPVEDEKDDSSTAVGTGLVSGTVFTPQPNAFSHPPSSRPIQTASTAGNIPGSYFPEVSVNDSTRSSTGLSNRTLTERYSKQQQSSFPQAFPSTRQSPRDFPAYSQSNQPDHDAALRASLTTLLSCAAAVRSTPKQQEASFASGARRQSQAEPRSLRLVPESELLDEEPADSPLKKAKIQTSPPILAPLTKQSAVTKRKARESSKERHNKKVRSVMPKSGVSDDDLIMHSTLMSWMISAGVVLVFSAISFSAGYAWGKEVGRLEGEMGIGSGSCGQEALRTGSGLRRLRWNTASSSIRA